jgi:hypothetical protein
MLVLVLVLVLVDAGAGGVGVPERLERNLAVDELDGLALEGLQRHEPGALLGAREVEEAHAAELEDEECLAQLRGLRREHHHLLAQQTQPARLREPGPLARPAAAQPLHLGHRDGGRRRRGQRGAERRRPPARQPGAGLLVLPAGQPGLGAHPAIVPLDQHQVVALRGAVGRQAVLARPRAPAWRRGDARGE